MASVIILTEPISIIDYSVVDGRIRWFKLRGETLYAEEAGIASEGWEQKLLEQVLEWRLNIDTDGHGFHAFIHCMLAKALLSE